MWNDVCDILCQNFFFSPAPHVTLFLKHLYNLLHIIWRLDSICKSLREGEHPINSMFVLPIFSIYATQITKPWQTPWDLLTTYQKPGCSTTWGNTQTGHILSWFLFFVKYNQAHPPTSWICFHHQGKTDIMNPTLLRPMDSTNLHHLQTTVLTARVKTMWKHLKKLVTYSQTDAPLVISKNNVLHYTRGRKDDMSLRNYATKITRNKDHECVNH